MDSITGVTKTGLFDKNSSVPCGPVGLLPKKSDLHDTTKIKGFAGRVFAQPDCGRVGHGIRGDGQIVRGRHSLE